MLFSNTRELLGIHLVKFDIPAASYLANQMLLASCCLFWARVRHRT